jgi:hypothetical protein
MSEIIPQPNNGPHKIKRFVALRNGEFWKASETVKDRNVTAGEVLMIAGIDNVDGQPHTIRLRLHPSKITRLYTEEKFLVDEFVSLFEFYGEEEAQKVREEEIKAIQDRLKDGQDLLHKACNNMEIIDRLIEEESTKEAGESNLPIKYEAVGADVIGAIRTQKVVSLMSTGLTATGIEQIKSGMEGQRNIAVKRSDWIAKRTQNLSQIADELTPFFEEKAAAALALTKDMRDHVDQLMKGIGNLNLYVLKNVEIETLKQGCSACESEKLSITQRVLYMDEELAVFEDIYDQFDCHNREAFFSALANHQGLIDQIFPTPRSVVAIATTRHNHDYQGQGYCALEAGMLSRENQRQFLLIRDGDNIHLVLSPELWHQFSSTLFPTVTETESPFRGMSGSEITYRDLEYTDALSRHERIALGYKRMLILLCGLDHNKKLFGDFYPGKPSLDFVSTSFQGSYFNFIHDEDGRGMLPPYCPLSLCDWVDQMNEEAGVGSRVVVRWEGLFSEKTVPGCYARGCSMWDRLQYTPSKEDQNGFIEGHLTRYEGQLVMGIPVKGLSRSGGRRSFTAKLNMSLAMKNANRFDFLCVDRLNPDDARFYLGHRPSRNLNVAGIRMLKCAIRMAEEDRSREKPVRDALINSLLESFVVEDEAAAIWLVDKGIAQYKCAHPKKNILSLLTDPKEFNILCDLLYQLSDKGRDISVSIKDSEDRVGRSVIRISLLANGQYCAYSTPLASERDDRLSAFNWVVKTRYRLLKKGISAQKPIFVLLSKSASSETVLYEAEDLDSYVVKGDPVFRTPTSKARYLDTIIQEGGRLQCENILSMKGDEGKIRQYMERYKRYRERVTYPSTNQYVIEPLARVGIGAITKNGELSTIGFKCFASDLIVWLTEGNDSLIRDFADIYAEIYANETHARGKLKQVQKRTQNRHLHEVMTLVNFTSKGKSGLLTKHGRGKPLDAHKYKSYSLNARIDDLKGRGWSTFFDPAIGEDLDAWLNIKIPDGFQPFFYRDVSFGEDTKIDIFICDEDSKSTLGERLSVIDSWEDAEARFKYQTCGSSIDEQGFFDVTYEWVEIEPREFLGVKAYKSYIYKEISRVPR